MNTLHRAGKVAIAILSAAVFATGAAGKGCSGGDPEPGQDEPVGCKVYGRDTNSKGQAYIEIGCDLPGGGLNKSTPLIPNINSFPGCTNGASWPECKNG